MAIEQSNSNDGNQILNLGTGSGQGLAFGTADIKGMSLGSQDSLIVTLKDGHTVTIGNFQALANANAKLTLQDGQVIDAKQLLETLSENAPVVHIGEPAAGQTSTYIVNGGQKYSLDFDTHQAGLVVTHKDGQIIMTFSDGAVLKLETDSHPNDPSQPQISANGQDFATLSAFEHSLHIVHTANANDNANDNGNNNDFAEAQKLAGIDPAAGGNGAAGSNHGYGFNSSIDAAPFSPENPLGPIGRTELAFGLPTYENGAVLGDTAVPSSVTLVINGGPPTTSGNPGGSVVNTSIPDIVMKEDHSITVPITATLNNPTSPTEAMTVTVTGINATAGSFTAPVGTYDAAHGTWTITLPPGQNLDTTFTFTPAGNSDVDYGALHATVTAVDTGGTIAASTDFYVTVDAVADKPTIEALGSEGHENTVLPVSIHGALTDLDGSETITGYKISGVPAGFTFNHGTDLGGGVWSLTPGDLTGLTASSPTNFVGTLNLTATVLNAETNLSGKEADFSDNTNSASAPFTLIWDPVAQPPTITVNNGQPNGITPDAVVKEDGTITIPVTANHGAGSSPNEVLTVTVTGIPGANVGTFSSPVGTYDAANHTWTITLPPGQNLATTFTFTPFPNSDVDFGSMHATVVATEPATNTTASGATDFYVTTDAVADVPVITTHNAEGHENTAVAVSIMGAVTDTDGSESITGYKISGVPAGFTFNHGTNAGGGVWTFTPGDLTGLTASSPANFVGSVNLTATVLNAETNLSGKEVDFTDNTNMASTLFTLTFDAVAQPPTITVNNGQPNGLTPDAVVKEDGTITIPVTANHGAGSSPNEVLTVTVTGIPGPNVGTFSSPVGTYDAAHGTWTITLPPGQNLATTFTFTPVHDSDVDFGSMHATVVATEPATNTSLSGSTDFYVTTDAVADVPTLHVDAAQGEAGHPIALNIQTAVTDTDGSEVIDHITITGLPAGATLSAGTHNPDGSYTLTPGQLAGLTLTTPHNTTGTFSLNVETVNRETVPASSGKEVDFSDNTNHNDATLSLTVTPNTTPILTVNGFDSVLEANLNPTTSASDHVNVDYGVDSPGAVTLNHTFSASVPTLTSGGQIVTVTQNGEIYTGTASNGNTVFTLDVHPDGNYTFTLDAPLDHPDATNPHDSIMLNFGITATDSDGDTANGTIQIRVVDDAPVAHNDVNNFFTSAGSTTGNVISGLNGGPGAADTLSHDGNNHVTEIDYGAQHLAVVSGQVTTIDGQNGELKINADGSYTYTLFTHTTTVDSAHNFTGNSFPADLAEGQAIGAADQNYLGELHSNLAINSSTTVNGTITYVSAGYNNSLGAYTVAADGTLQAAQMIDPTIGSGYPTPFAPNLNFNVGASANATELGFFLVANGAANNNGYSGLNFATGHLNFVYDYGQADHRAATINDNGNQVSLVFTDAGGHDTVLQGPVYFTTDRGGSNSLNADGIVHTLSGVSASDPHTLTVAFEDWPPSITDKDYNDVVFNVQLTDHTPVTTPSTGSDQFVYTLTDNDGDSSAASLTFNGAAPPSIILTFGNNPPITSGPPNSATTATGLPDVVTKEDHSVTVPVTATLNNPSSPGEALTVTVTGINAAAGTFSAPTGTYDAAHGTWTVTLPPGQNLNTAFTFTPTHDSDVDFGTLHVTATATDAMTGTVTAAANSTVVVDAVADVPTITAHGSEGLENTALAVSIAGAVTDTDGSETITGYKISGVPAGFSFNHGTDLGGGVWSLTPGDLTGLTATSTHNYVGSLNLTATVLNAETNLSGKEVDFSDNTNSASAPFTLIWDPITNTPTITVNGASGAIPDVVVKEDHSVTIPVTASLGGNNTASEVLTVTVTGIPGANVGTFSSPVGTYDAAHGTWTVTLAPGQNLNTAFTFTPTHDSDVDFGSLHATASSFDPSTGTTATATADFYVTTDAVADVPTIAVHDVSSNQDTAIAIGLSGAVTDTDGSETITGYKIAGVPAGFTFNHGTNAGGGVWTFTPTDLTGLTLSSTSHYTGSVNLTATVFNAETNLSGKEVDFSDNTNSNSAAFTATWQPATIDTPTIMVNNGVHDAVVKEDQSITIPVVATLGAHPTATEILTVTLTGIPGPNVGTLSSPIGTYDAAHGTWTVTLPPGQALNSSFTFTPFHNSDVDFGNLHATASVYDPATNLSASASTDFYVTTDAVVDVPVLTVSDTAAQGFYYLTANFEPLNVSSAVTDTDGSEVITKITFDLNSVLTGINPDHATLADIANLNWGTQISPGVYEIDVNAQSVALNGLAINFPGTNPEVFNLHPGPQVDWHTGVITVKTYVTEANLSGKEVDFTDNSIVVTKTLNVNFGLTPLVVDLTGHGFNLTDQSHGVHFDLNGDGKADLTSWIGDGTGLLALPDQNGHVVNGSQLFGPTTGNGFAELAAHDTNHDNVINAQDTVFNQLEIWQDGNHDGIAQAGELHHLSDYGITAISLATVTSGQAVADNTITDIATVTFADGHTTQIGDAIFNFTDSSLIGVGVHEDGTIGNDVLYGTQNNDVLAGHGGNDTLYGGAGADTFVFDLIGKGTATVADFNTAEGDKLDLSKLLTEYNPLQNSIDNFVHATSANGNTTISVDVHGTGQAANFVNVAVLQGVAVANVDDMLAHKAIIAAAA